MNDMQKAVSSIGYVGCFFLLSIFGCSEPGTSGNEASEMLRYLQDSTVETFYVPQNIYANTARAHYFDSLLQKAPAFQKNQLQFDKAVALLNAGETVEAIAIFERLNTLKAQKRFLDGMNAHAEEMIDDYLALSYLRLGEQENCILDHSSASCIIPLDPEGFHEAQQGSERAIGVYESILGNRPNDLISRWLANIAYMTLGEYPENVPKDWLIPDSAFASEYPIPRFLDVASGAGLDYRGMAGAAITDDFNGDGYFDVVLSEWHPKGQLRYFVNQADGTFKETTEKAGLTGLTGGANLEQTDYNNDGLLDIWVIRGGWLYGMGNHPNSLLRNNGNGTFTDVTIEAGLLSFRPSQTATWSDFNNDGWIDVFVGNETSSGTDFHPCELFINNKDGTFRETAGLSGITVSNKKNREFCYVKGVTSGDYDRDGRPDVYVSVFGNSQPNRLFHNTGNDAADNPIFEEVTEQAGLGQPFSSFPTWFWDFDNDGWLDIFVAGYERSDVFGSISKDIAAEYLGEPHRAQVARLFRNQGDGTFIDVAPRVQLDRILYAMGANFGDLDNDGFLDLYLSTGEVNLNSIIPNRMFRNQSGEIFQDVTSAGGFGHIQKGHAISFSDLDRDGDQDIYAVLGGAYEGDVFQNALFQNPGMGNHWIALALEGVKANCKGIGAKITVWIEEGGRQRQIYRELNSGGSFGANPLQMHIGIGQAKKIQKVRVEWPGSGTVQVFENLPIDLLFKIKEGERPVAMALSPFQFSKQSSGAHHQH